MVLASNRGSHYIHAHNKQNNTIQHNSSNTDYRHKEKHAVHSALNKLIVRRVGRRWPTLLATADKIMEYLREYAHA